MLNKIKIWTHIYVQVFYRYRNVKIVILFFMELAEVVILTLSIILTALLSSSMYTSFRHVMLNINLSKID